MEIQQLIFSNSLGDVINTWRKGIDLEAISVTEGPNLAENLKVPFTYCWSPALVPKPADWAPHIGRFFNMFPVKKKG